jgi:GNAT acetyltransferase-like protein
MSSPALAEPAQTLGSDTPVADVRVLRSADEVDAVRSALVSNGLAPSEADMDLFRVNLRSWSQVIRPHVLVVEREGRIDAVLLARLEHNEMPAKFGYATLYRPTLRCLTVVSGGVAGSDADQRLLAEELLRSLRSGDADVLLLQHARVDSPLHAAVVQAAPRLSRQRFIPQTPHWVLDIPDSTEKLHALLPKGVRDNLRRYNRKLAREFGDRLEVRCHTAPDDLDAIMRDVEAVAAASYQRGLGAGFETESDAPVVQAGLAGGWFRAWVLYLDGAPCAFETGYVCGSSVVIAAKGFDPEFGRHHVGKVLQLRILEDLCADPVVETLDFGFGDAEYKQRLSTRGWADADVVIYGRTVRGLTANAVRTVVLGADRLARRVAGKDRIAVIKRRWRDRRTPTA